MRTAHGSFAVSCCALVRVTALLLSYLVSPIAVGIAQEQPVAEATTPSPVSATEASTTPLATSELYQRIDALLASNDDPLVASRAADGELLRRLSLDVRGVVPTRDELDAFVQDQSPDRWRNWVNRFLADPLFDEHLVSFLDRTIMMRRANAHVDRVSWLNFLREQVANNTPLDQFSRRIINSPWWNKDHRAAQRFYLDRGGDANLIARDFGRVFLGQDLQCAQCHDHPLVDDYKQTDYHGIVAYFAPSKLAEASYKDAEGKDQKLQLYIETPAGDAPFESVFNKGVPYRSGPRLPSRAEHFEEYVMPDERLVSTAAADAFNGIPLPPKQSRRQNLAEQLATRDNIPFVSNWANRFWAMTFGQGIVHPVDMHHPDNPPIHPTLFALITEGLVTVDMQPRRFIEQLVLTQVYQRGGFSPLETNSPDTFPRSLTPEQRAVLNQITEAKRVALASTIEAHSANEVTARERYEAAEDTWSDVQAQRAAVRTELDAAEAAILGEKKKSSDAAAVLAAAEKKRADTQARITLLDEASAKLQQAVALSGADDPELKQAIELSKQRSEAIKVTLPVAEKGVTDAKAAADAIAQTLAQAVAKTQEVVAKLKPIHDSLHNADEAVLATRTQWSQANIAKLDARRKLEQAEHILAWLVSMSDIERVQSEIVLVAQSVSTVESEMAAADQAVVAARSKLAESTRVQATNGENLASAQKAMQLHATELAQLQHSIDTLTQSAKLISAPETLNVAMETIRLELDSRNAKTGQLESQIAKAQQSFNESTTLVTADQQAMADRQSEATQVTQKLATAREQMNAKQSELSANHKSTEERWAVVNEECARTLDKSQLFALSPEQFCWSILRITGQLDAYIQAELNELEKQSPLAADADDATRATRKRQAVRTAFDKLRGNADVFVSLYASGPDKTQDDFFASADQALFTANAGSIFAWAAPGNNNVTQQAIALTDPTHIAQGIYWSLLCRQPSAAETQLVTEQLATAGDARNTVIHEMVWGILASAEFRFCR